MPTFKSRAGRPAYYTIREAAWILGVKRSDLSRQIRVGAVQAVWRGGRLVIPAKALAALLGEPTDDPQSRGAP